MSALKPKRLSSEEEEQDKVEYVEVKASSQIKAILKAQKNSVKKEEKPAIPEKQKEKKETPQPIEQKKDKKYAFIKDDRQREYPKRRQEAKQQKKHKPEQPIKQEAKEEKQAYKRYEDNQRNRKQENTKQRKINEERKEDQEKQYPSKRAKYVEKQQEKEYYQQKETYSKKVKYAEKFTEDADYEQDYEPKKTKYVQKTYKYKETRKNNRIQIQQRNGEQIQVQLLQSKDQFQNQVFIGKKTEKDYISLCKTLLKKYDFIVLRAFGNLVAKAFLIAGLLASEFSQLRQINIPSTVKVNQFLRQEKKMKTRGAISIELSLNSLDKRHMGYQISNHRNTSKGEEKKNFDKSQPNRKFKEKEENDRQLR